MSPNHLALAVLAVVAGLAGGCQRPAPPAAPAPPNFHRVGERLYRGGRPDAADLAELKRLGVRTVVDLAGFAGEADQARAAGLDYVAIPMIGFRASDRQVAEFLKIAADPARAPVYVHCQKGTNRTGTMAAAWRMAVEGWSAQAAAEEMHALGCEHHPATIRDYLEHLHMSAIKAEAGIR